MTGMKVLVVGGGGREHALGWALAGSASVARVESAPGNPGLAGLGPVHPVKAGDVDGQEELVRREGYDLVVIGPEAPLARGLADRLRAGGTPVFGPGAAAARLEASKAFAKDFMSRHRIPTARHRTVTRMEELDRALAGWERPPVVKASGLAAGKGVTVAETPEEARAAAAACLAGSAFGEAGRTVVLEERLTGEEVSVFAITDGRTAHLLPGSQDHKRAYDGDTGPNTGGMGAYSPAPLLTPALLEAIRGEAVEPTLEGLRADGLDYRGLLYLGIMVTAAGPRVLEYNVRFGDPETEAVLPRLGYDLGAVLLAAARGELGRDPLPEPRHAAAACVVAAARDYPRAGARGLPITGLEEAREGGALVFHAGTAMENGVLTAAGGRVLTVAGVGDGLAEALRVAYRGLDALHFEGMRCRRDIGRRALGREGGGGREEETTAPTTRRRNTDG